MLPSVGALLLTMLCPADKDIDGGLGSNSVGPDFSMVNAFVGEVCMTCLLADVVLETASCLLLRAAGSSRAWRSDSQCVLSAHGVDPVDGGSIHPTPVLYPQHVKPWFCAAFNRLSCTADSESRTSPVVSVPAREINE